jgi:hypothetical protein
MSQLDRPSCDFAACEMRLSDRCHNKSLIESSDAINKPTSDKEELFVWEEN